MRYDFLIKIEAIGLPGPCNASLKVGWVDWLDRGHRIACPDRAGWFAHCCYWNRYGAQCGHPAQKGSAGTKGSAKGLSTLSNRFDHLFLRSAVLKGPPFRAVSSKMATRFDGITAFISGTIAAWRGLPPPARVLSVCCTSLHLRQVVQSGWRGGASRMPRRRLPGGAGR